MNATLKTRQGRLHLTTEAADRLLQIARGRLGLSQATADNLAEYRDMVAIYLSGSNSDIDSEARQRLEALQQELGLSDDQADELETHVRLKVAGR